MNKKLSAFLTGQGMTVNGNRAYGIVNGYEVNASICMFDNFTPFRLHISFYSTDEQKRDMEAKLRAAALKFCHFRFTQFGLWVGLNDITLGRLVKRLPSVFETLFGCISINGGLTSEFCPVCGKQFGEDKKLRTVDDMTINLDSECVENMNAVINEENKDFKEAPNNYLLGFLGAVIGGIAGIAVAVALYYVGFYSSLAAIVSIVLGTFLYRKFRGKPKKMMIVIVAVTTIIMMALSVFLIYLVEAAIAAKDAGLSMSAMDAFLIVMEDKELATHFYTDLAMVLLFSAIGIVLQIFYTLKMIKRKDSIK